MRVLIALGHPGFLRNFESGIAALLDRGHHVHIAIGKHVAADTVTGAALQVLDRLPGRPGKLTHGLSAPPEDTAWAALGSSMRTALNYWRYLDREYDGAPLLRSRARAEAPQFARRAFDAWWFDVPPVRHVAHRVLHGLERRLPIDRVAVELLHTHQPDVVVVTPLLYYDGQQAQMVRACRAAGVPAVYAAGSWDHLTTKGLVHEVPDLTVVWNEGQADEARRFHAIPRALCEVVGAQAFDHWFTHRPQVSREEFCRQLGLPPERKILLYLCSSKFIAGDERDIVHRWAAAVRGHRDPQVASANLLIRPHPQNAAQWEHEPLPDPQMVVWPRAGANPVSGPARADFYHSIYFSSAVVGVNTSAQIESAIVGRPVFSVLSERYAGTQEGTLHFRHLQKAGGGLLHSASSLDEHCEQLVLALGGEQAEARTDAQAAAFVKAFVRPRGVDRSAADVFADAVEDARPSKVRLGSPLLEGSRLHSVLRQLAQGAFDAERSHNSNGPSVDLQEPFLNAERRIATARPSVGGGTDLVCLVPDPAHASAARAATADLVEQGVRVTFVIPAIHKRDRDVRALGKMETAKWRPIVVGVEGRQDHWRGLLAGRPRSVWARAAPAAAYARLVLLKSKADTVLAVGKLDAAPWTEDFRQAAGEIGIRFARVGVSDSGAAALSRAEVPDWNAPGRLVRLCAAVMARCTRTTRTDKV